MINQLLIKFMIYILLLNQQQTMFSIAIYFSLSDKKFVETIEYKWSSC